MEVIIKNLIPKPMLDMPDLDSHIWLRPSVTFLPFRKYLIYSQSGKGKSSLLSILYGQRTDYNGDVVVDGKNIRDYTKNDWVNIRRNKMSMVFQGLGLFNNLTVEENIMLKNKLTDYASESEILSWLDTLEIKSLYSKKVGEISFGQKQRVALVRALCQPFELLMLDEPFSHIDIENRNRAESLITAAVSKQNASMILSSLNDDQNNDFEKYRI